MGNDNRYQLIKLFNIIHILIMLFIVNKFKNKWSSKNISKRQNLEPSYDIFTNTDLYKKNSKIKMDIDIMPKIEHVLFLISLIWINIFFNKILQHKIKSSFIKIFCKKIVEIVLDLIL